MEGYVKQFDDSLNSALKTVVRKPTVIRGIVHLLIVLYAIRFAPNLPVAIQNLYENPYARLVVFSLVLWTAQFSPSTSILIAIAFLITVSKVTQTKLEFLENVDTTMAPSKQVAVDGALAIMDSQAAQPTVVDIVEQKQDTILVQPQVVQTPEGPMVQNPTVVIAPVVVQTPDGNQVMVKPDVTVVQPNPEASAPKEAQAGCYPVRQYDLSNLSGFDNDSAYGAFKL